MYSHRLGGDNSVEDNKLIDVTFIGYKIVTRTKVW